MTQTVRAFSPSLWIGTVEIIALQSGENGFEAVTKNGDSLPIDPKFFAVALDASDLAIADAEQVERIAAALSNLPLFWREEDGQFVAKTLAGGEVRRPAEGVLAGMDGDAGGSAVDYLNVTTSVVGANPSVLGSLAGGLAKGVGGQIGGAIGGMVLDLLFPPKPMQSYFDELYERLAKLVHQEITGNEIEKINGTLDGVQAFIRNIYVPRKKKGAAKKELLEMIRPYVDEIYKNVTYTLLQDRFRKPGLPAFLVGASVHLSLLQEMALVDPMAKKPRDSSFAESVKKQKQEYADAARATWTNILDARFNLIEEKVVYINVPMSQNKLFGSGSLIDHDTNTTVWTTKSMVEWGLFKSFNRNKYLETLKNGLSQDMAGDGGIDQLFSYWDAAYDAIPEK